jgi:fumarate reductase subunit D
MMMAKRSPQPFLWLLFSAGGMITALLAPIILLLFGIAFPLGLIASPHRERMLVLSSPLIRVVLLGVCVLALLHCAYRLSYILRDGLRLQHPRQITTMISYAGAITGSVIAGYVLVHLTGSSGGSFTR